MRYAMGIDLGGTNIAAGLATEDYRLIRQDSIPTRPERPPEEILADMADMAVRLAGEEGIPVSRLEAVGIGVPGTANRESGILEYANNLHLDGFPMAAALKERLGVPVRFDNDANAAAWGEYLAGAGRGSESFLMVTLGTGVGGGIILGGRLVEGCNFAAGELGHMVIVKDGKPCTCGRKGCFEAYASASALEELAGERLKDSPESELYRLWKSGRRVDGRAVTESVKKGDGCAAGVLGEYTEYLALGIVNLINIFQPEVLCIGGGLSRGADTYFEKLKTIVSREVYTRDSERQTELKPAVLGNEAGIIGAAFLPEFSR